jgi:ribosomal protein L25 (general stress protein Ctc)
MNLFEDLTQRTLVEIDNLAKSGSITDFERKSFISFCISAQVAAETYSNLEGFPYIEIRTDDDIERVEDAYVFLCLVELHEFLERSKNSKKIMEVFRNSPQELIISFAKIFGGEEAHSHFNKTLSHFDKILADMRDIRDLWYNQALEFVSKISQNNIDVSKLVHGNLSNSINLSLLSQGVQIENTKLFDKIVLNEEHEEDTKSYDIHPSIKEKLGKLKWLERARHKGKISKELYNQEKKKIEGEIDQSVLDNEQEMINKVSGSPNPTLRIKEKHIVIRLKCPRCGTEGENTCNSICFRILGKDRKGYLYFECPDCKEHLQYDPVTGNIRTRKGLLGFLFGRLS